jgi:glycosyltransferase involved in cell wall biosynthesis
VILILWVYLDVRGFIANMDEIKPIDSGITVIIPLFNGEKYIQETLASVAIQSLRPKELIVVNDGSTDSSPDLVRRVEMPFPVQLLHQENGGQSAARNLGARQASGEYLAFLDQDDLWNPNHLERLHLEMLKDPLLGWVYSDVDEIDRVGKLVTLQFLRTLEAKHPKQSLSQLLGEDMFVLPSSVLVLKKAYDAVGGFDARLSGCEDDDLFLRIFRAGYRNAFIQEALTKFRVRADSASHSKRMSESREIFANKLIDMFPDEPEMERYYIRDCITPRFYRYAKQQYRKHVLLGNKQEYSVNLQRVKHYASLMRFSFLAYLKMRLLHLIFEVPVVARLFFKLRRQINI